MSRFLAPLCFESELVEKLAAMAPNSGASNLLARLVRETLAILGGDIMIHGGRANGALGTGAGTQ